MTIEEHLRLMKPKLWDFIDGLIRRPGPTNGWFTGRIAQVYFRLGAHAIGNQIEPTLDLANITISRNFRRRGIFRAIEGLVSEYLEQTANAPKILYIENVLDPQFAKAIERMGFERVPGGDLEVTSWFKRVQSFAKETADDSAE